MSRDDDKQVQDALLAIRKLVEMSGDQMGANEDVLTLDNVVWRNPVKEEAEDAPHAETAVAKAPVDAPSQGHDIVEELLQKAPVASASLSVSSRDLDMPQNKEAVKRDVVIPPVTSPLALDDEAPELVAIKEHETPPKAPEEVTDLTSPLGRRGGGFYSAIPQKPAIKALADEVSAKRAPDVKVPQGTPVSAPVSVSQPIAHEPALTDFHGADFNFSAAEGLMTAASFTELNQPLTKPIAAEVNIPVAEPAVSDPVSDVQAMFPAEEPAEEPEEHQEEIYSGHPNLHVVSDQTQDADDEEEGFSGAVRLALRSIIKEQVSTWLQGNMTGLIEEALTSPQKRPSSSSKPSSKKR